MNFNSIRNSSSSINVSERPKKTFELRQNIEYGDSVLVIKNNKTITGILYILTITNVRYGKFFDYDRYHEIFLITNNNKIRIDRYNEKNFDCELEMYNSKIVLIEKFKSEIYHNVVWKHW